MRDFYAKKVSKAQAEHLSLKNRLDFKKTLSAIDQTRYYSAWHYAAIHLLVGIPQFQTKETLHQRLRISIKKISEALEFLVSCGLAIEDHGRFRPGVTNVHLGNDSPMITKHHTNWRLQAIQSLENETSEELHYSSVITIALADMPKIRKALADAIDQVRKIVRDSKEDNLCCYSLDFFKVVGE